MTEPAPIRDKTDEELAREARAGSRRSFEELARRYKRRLFVYLRPRLGSDQDAEDMVQETFLKLFRNIRNYNPAFRFSTWLYTSAGRLAISSFRGRRFVGERMRGEARDVSPDPAERMAEDAASDNLWDAARTLGGNQFRALWLRYGEDMTVDEIARALGKSRLSVRVLLHRARMNLAKRLSPAPGRAKAAETAAAGETTPG